MSTVVSARIPKWVKEKLEKHGINISEVIKNKLLEEVEKLENNRLDASLEQLKTRFSHIDLKELAKIIDESRKEM
ncbi:MAG: hypothetical protein DRJ31_07505 [Candidatus Methanomethylicota archaeon]|uniref:CopG family transcriptional regulator n=1 Tax=Thermoproteota archaeon TaxID=2056631 RepID=A0A497ELT9_9CREN|nr:MAG: hypothetical protein DRJ31_07505 [Candidatus Verstraetearchaeota archaeon]